MKYIDFLSPLHKSTKRDYLARVNDHEYPKHIAADLAKKWDFDYWDGDRRINYGGYKYIPDRWKPVAELLIEHYKLTNDSKILDVGCGKAFLLFEIKQILPSITVRGLDISEYAKNNSKIEMKEFIDVRCCSNLPYNDKEFDLAISINTFHNLANSKLELALCEFSRVSKSQYLCVESYRNELEKANLLYWQVTCEQFNNLDDWEWWFNKTNYQGNYSFIFFE
jgi:protein-L-isoaspartate(D-aspartate) O-methyltransferase